MKVLDVCCGSKMVYFDKNDPDVTFQDCRELSTILCDKRTLEIKPDIIGDFRNMVFKDKTFDLVIFDPPHFVRAGADSYMGLKYGILNELTWRSDLAQGFDECFRVLKDSGTLIFKWSEYQIPLKEILEIAPCRPLLGDKRAKTHWLVFIKR